MTREQRENIQKYIHEHATEYFERDKFGKGYICPICGSGSGKNGTGITENPKAKGHFTCWGGNCFKNADIFEIIGKQFDITDFNEIFKKACEIFRISLDGNNDTRPSPKTKTKNKTEKATPTLEAERSKEDYTDFIKEASENIDKTDYHRGISLETLRQYRVGYVPEWRIGEKAPYSPRIIIPNDSGGYLARDTRTELTAEQAKYTKLRRGSTGLFNANALKQNLKPVFIVEGEFDALSIIDAGGEAVALCSVVNIGKLIEAVKDLQQAPNLILLLDSDEAGRKGTEKLITALREIKFFSYRQTKIPDYKDTNEFLIADRAKFFEWVQEAETIVEEASGLETEYNSYYLQNLMEEIQANRAGRYIPTGFENLDNLLDGGLHSGLYFLGANSSLGKTSLMLQMLDYIASSGRDVILFSLEMARTELMAKSLSRLSLEISMREHGNYSHAKTTRGILQGNYSKYESKIIAEALKIYESGTAQHLIVRQGIGNIGVIQVREDIEEYLARNKDKEAPVIAIDYTQILAPFDIKMSDKQNTDKAVLELKRISRDYDIPIIGISSFNRENYRTPVSMASFKESGAIEYSSDVLMAAQYLGWDYREKEKESERLFRLAGLHREISRRAARGEPQQIQLKILKNRNGARGDVAFEFFPMFNYFRPCDLPEEM